MPPLRKLPWWYGWTCAVTFAVWTTGAHAQESKPPADPEPTLPEVKVEATPLPTTTSPDSVFNNSNLTPTPGTPPSITQNSIFGSPPPQGYRAPTSTTGTIVNVPDIQLPASVSVVTSEVLHDQQALRINDVFRDVAGAAKLGDQLRPDSFILRGFEVQSRNYRKNGLLDPTFTPRDFANIERIEILKGPSSILYGASQPSGTVNLITKKPLNDDFSRWTTQIGSYNFQRHTIDTNGRVNDDGNVLFRINAAYENSDGFRDFGYNERAFVAPSFSYIIDEDTAITWEGEYLKDRRRFDTGVAAVDGSVSTLPITTYLGEPGNDFQTFQDWRQSVFLDHRIDDIWTMRAGATTIFYHAPSSGTFPDSQTPGTTEFTRGRQNITQFFEQYYGLTVNLAGEYELAGMEHKTVFGTEQGWFISNNFRSESSLPGFPPLPIDGANPVYTNPPFVLAPAVFDSGFRQNRHGFYAQDLVEFNEHWSAMYGLRFDHATVTFDRQLAILGIPILGPINTENNFDYWTPRAGLIYQPIPDLWSLYGNYSRSFDPPGGGPRLTTQSLRPELGESWELGTKLQLTEGLAAQAAWFWIQKQNITIDRQVAAPPFFVTSQAGQQEVQGVELSLLGQLTDRWSTTTNYTFADALISDDTDPTIDGRRPRNVPRHTVNMWSRYNVIQNTTHTLGGGLGMVFVDDRLAAYGGTLRLPDYTRWDSGIFYKRGLFDAALYIENMFDKRYYAGSVSDLQIAPGAPTTLRGQIGLTF